MIEKINLKQKFESIRDYWNPRVAGEVNESYVKLVKFQGPFEWHHHDDEDEMFLVVNGRFTMRLKDGDVTVEEGEFVIVPKGVEHCPVADHEVSVLLFEPKTTLNTGNVRNERTKEKLERI
ncbi:MAG TPA: cupin domain-containing protein [Bacteroidota bacterium]|nr:cupin domain-containing protein [Bacteroidota bacterium]